MSVVTRTGDDGTTALMYGRRVPKNHPRIVACGAVDELNSALGLGRATASHDYVRQNILAIQQDLVGLMGELATDLEDMERYRKDGFAIVTTAQTGKLDALAAEIEAQQVYGKGWTMPGENLNSAALDHARSVCRRCEREVLALLQSGQVRNEQAGPYLNRLSDVLWLMGRWVEKQRSGPD